MNVVDYSIPDAVASARSPKVLTEGKVTDQRDANPCKEGNARARKPESEGRGFESRC